jgi:ergothioneine biosynthesis protein EgtB
MVMGRNVASAAARTMAEPGAAERIRMHPDNVSPLSGRAALAARYHEVRDRSMMLAAPLSEADAQVQSMPDASPAKWHLAHVTWFFETFLLEAFEPGFRPFHPAFRVLFNSYYNAVGDKHPRPRRGQITRPDLADVKAYRAQVDERVASLIDSAAPGPWEALLELGMQHEQQHQELLLTDIKHALSCNPLHPVYQPGWPLAAVAPVPLAWHAMEPGLAEIGHAGAGFAFDNETPRHKVWLRPYALANRLVTHGEWREFVADGGYRDPRWWLSAGWDWVVANAIEAPLYWQRGGALADWHSFTLHGLVPLDGHTPVTHISYFEADAFARWFGATHPGCGGTRLPTEAEWEHAAAPYAATEIARGNFVESRALHPLPVASAAPGPMQLYGDAWEWTSSSYAAYPGFRSWEGAVGEYNGKFMVNQYVLRGGSCATPRSHLRATYRNFFPTDARWQFSGLRLARDID